MSRCTPFSASRLPLGPMALDPSPNESLLVSGGGDVAVGPDGAHMLLNALSRSDDRWVRTVCITYVVGEELQGNIEVVAQVRSCTTSLLSNRGRLVFGALIGVLVYVIRAWGNYPDAVAFAVLLANFAAPFIDNYTLPRTYGHVDRRRATEKEDQS